MLSYFRGQLQPLQDLAISALDAWTSFCKEDLGQASFNGIVTQRLQIEALKESFEQAITNTEVVRKEIARIAK